MCAPASNSVVDELRQRIQRLACAPIHGCGPAVRNRGHRPGFARWGLTLGALHEVAGGGNGAIDGAAAALFTAGIAARTKGMVLWCVPGTLRGAGRTGSSRHRRRMAGP